MSSFFSRLMLGTALAVAPLVVSAQTSPFDPATPVPGSSSPATARAASNLDPLLPPNQVRGKYRRYLTKRYYNDREARALLHRVGRKRVWGTIWSIVGFNNAVRLFGSYEPVTTRNANGTVTTTTPSPVGNIVFAGVFGAMGISRWSRYNNQKLYRAFIQYDAGQGFPNYMDNAIKDKDYDR